MSGSRTPPLPFESAADVFAAFPEIAEDLTARPDPRPALDFVEALARSEIPEEALTFAAYALDRRLAVWWGHECLRQLGDLLTSEDVAMMELAARWVGDPNEATRYAAMNPAMDAPAKTPGVWIALAAGWSSGSMAPEGQPEAKVPAHLCPRAINAAVLSALARVDRPTRPEMLQRFVRIVRKLAEAS